MPLEQANVPVSFAGGVDTKTDPKQVIPGKMLVLQNASFQNPKEIRKRDGFTALPNAISGGGSVSAGQGVASFENELLSFDGSSVYSYSPGLAQQINRGNLTPASLAIQPIVRNSYTQTQPDAALATTGLQCYLWSDSGSGAVNYQVTDSVTDAVIVNNQNISSTASKAKVLTLGSYFVILYFDTGSASLKALSLSTATGLVNTTQTIAADIDATNPFFDACVLGSTLYLVYAKSSTSVAFYSLSSILALSSQYVVSGITEPTTCMSIVPDNNGHLWAAWSTTTNVYALAVNTALNATTVAVQTVDSVDAANITQVATSAGTTLFYDVLPTNAGQTPLMSNYINTNTVTIGGSVGTASTYNRGLGLASKAFVYGGSTYFLGVYAGVYATTTTGGTSASTLQPTYFLIGPGGKIVAKCAPSLAGGYYTTGLLPECPSVTAGTYVIPYLYKDTLASVNGNIVSNTGLNSATFTFPQSLPLSKLTLGNNLLLASGQLWQYDGENVTEQGFHLYPEPPSGDYQAVSGGLSTGTYSYIATYEWTDQQGNTHRSAPSAPLSVVIDGHKTTFAGSGSSGANTITSSISQALPGFVTTWLISGPGVPAATKVTNITSSGMTRLYTLTLSNNLTANTSGPFVITPLYSFTNVVNATAASTNRIFPYCSGPVVYLIDSNGSYTCNNPGALVVGATLTFSYDASFNASYTIASITNGVITFASGSPPVNTPALVTLPFSAVINSTTARTVQQVPNATLNVMSIGDTVTFVFSAVTYTGMVTSIAVGTQGGGTQGTFTINTDLPSTGGNQTVPVIDYFGPSRNFVVGQQITGPGITGTATVTGFGYQKTGAVNTSLSYLTINQQILSQSQGTYTSSDVYSSQLTVYTLKQTLKNNVRIVLYRTIANGTVYYQASSVSAPYINDPTVDYITVNDSVADNFLIGNNQLYTTGGEVDNINAPEVSAIWSFKSRALYLSPEAPLQFGYSKQVIQGTPVEFSSLDFYENVDQRIGSITAIGSLDDKIVLFGASSKYYVVGNGPSPSGANNDFTDAVKIAGTTGCTVQSSIIEIPIGLVYQDITKGVYLLDRSLQEQYIGAEVEAYLGQPISSASLVPNSKKVQFTLASGANLIYDYYVNQWEVDVFPAEAFDSTVYNNTLVYIQPDGVMMQQTPGTYSDNGAVIPISLTTSWLSFAGLAGFQRVWELQILGAYKSPHTLNVNIFTDFGTTPAQTVTIPVLSDPGLYQFRIHLKPQQSEAIQIQIVESETAAGEGFSLSSLTFVVGIQRGAYKLSAGKSY